jgi:hypothetical protein
MNDKSFDLKRGMNAWVTQNASIRTFADALGYQYTNAWTILRGKQPVTVEAVGRFALAYGPAALGEMLNMAGLTEQQEVKFQNGVPVAENVNHGEPVYVAFELEAGA